MIEHLPALEKLHFYFRHIQRPHDSELKEFLIPFYNFLLSNIYPTAEIRLKTDLIYHVYSTNR